MPGFVKRFLKYAIRRVASFIIKRPILKALAKRMISYFPELRSRLFTITMPDLPVYMSVQDITVYMSDLTPRAAKIYENLEKEAKLRKSIDAHSN